MNQLIGRTYRRGQTQEVIVIFFLLAGSIDEQMHAAATSKVATEAGLLRGILGIRHGSDCDLEAPAESSRGALCGRDKASALLVDPGEICHCAVSYANPETIDIGPWNPASPEPEAWSSSCNEERSHKSVAPAAYADAADRSTPQHALELSEPSESPLAAGVRHVVHKQHPGIPLPPDPHSATSSAPMRDMPINAPSVHVSLMNLTESRTNARPFQENPPS